MSGHDGDRLRQTALQATIIDSLLQALAHCRAETRPYRHWHLERVLPEALADAVTRLPVPAPEIDDTQGRRETHNATRWFLSRERQARFPVCRALAASLGEPAVTARLEALCGIELTGSHLRIEYCQDRAGFWLEPHTDIAAKRFTWLIYLTRGAEAKRLGTDIYDGAGALVGGAPGGFNSGLIFVPGADTWHGFRRRAFSCVRRSLIVNFVEDAWRARHELADPDRPIG